jgi:hypothetical protein
MDAEAPCVTPPGALAPQGGGAAGDGMGETQRLWEAAVWWFAQIVACFAEPVVLAARGLSPRLHDRLARWLGGVEHLVRRLQVAAALRLDVRPGRVTLKRRYAPRVEDASDSATWRVGFCYWRTKRPHPASPTRGRSQTGAGSLSSSRSASPKWGRSGGGSRTPPSRWDPTHVVPERPYPWAPRDRSIDPTAPVEPRTKRPATPRETWPGHHPVIPLRELAQPAPNVSAKGLARRIEALARTLDNPDGRARRLAFRIARASADAARRIVETDPDLEPAAPCGAETLLAHELVMSRWRPRPPDSS